jgi:hypothetical protein
MERVLEKSKALSFFLFEEKASCDITIKDLKFIYQCTGNYIFAIIRYTPDVPYSKLEKKD